MKKQKQIISDKKNILVAISGLTPQIVSEAFYCLTVKKKIPINEIYIITTERGRLSITGKDKDPRSPKTPLKKEIEELCTLYKIPVPLFENNSKHIYTAEEESIQLYDIRDDKANKLFPNKVAEVLGKLTSEYDTVLHCCLSGGRKSMSAHLALALSLFARTEDKLYHVLTDEKFESKGFYPKNKAEDDALIIAEVPFIRLRGVMREKLEKISSYSDLVEKTQKELSVLTDTEKLILDIEAQRMEFKGCKLHLEPQLFTIYYIILIKKLRGENKISVREVNGNPEFSREFLDLMKQNYPYAPLREKTQNDLMTKGFDIMEFRSKISKINRKLRELITDQDYYNRYMISTERTYGDTKYYIDTCKDKVKIIYK